MGVLEFFGTLLKNNVTSSSIKLDFREKMNIDHFFLDFNSIIYGSKAKILSEVNNFMISVIKAMYEKKSININIFNELFKKHEMQHVQIDIKPDTDPMKVIEMFHNHFDDKRLDKMVIVATINTVFHLIRTYCNNKTIKTLMLALDGTPSKGKMVEQKQRRYLGAITEEYKKKILGKYKNHLLEQKNFIYLIKKYPIEWATKMSPGTEFMDKLSGYLRSEKIQTKFKLNRSQMKIVLSDIHEIGEGEKKIVNYINKYHHKTKETVVIYSPDADVILLSMILPINNIYYLRHNQQTSFYDLIDIKLLKENIAYYINNHPDFSKETFDIHRINYDIVCISTLFGNDFVPKIESLNVKQGFQHILDTYLQILLKFKEKSYYLVKVNDDNFSLSFVFLKNMLKSLLPIEEDFIKHNNVYNKYINAGRIKDVFDYMEINEKNIVSTVNNLKNEYRNLTHTIQTRGNLSYFENHDELMKSLKKSINVVIDDQNVNTTYLSNQEFIQLLIDVYSKTREFPRININLNSYSNHMDDQYHKKKLEQNHITDPYDKEIYRFDNMLDEYYVKFNNSPLVLTQNKIVPFYAEYFHVKLFDGKSLSKDAKKVMHDYLEGMLWVFNSYFNDKTYVNTWCYLHEKSPLLTHLVMYLEEIDRKTFQDMYDGLKKYYVADLSTYFTPLEQLAYVSPIVDNVLKLFPENYRSFITSHELDPFLKKYFINIEQIVDKLWSEKVSSELDCKGMAYLTKCIVKSMHRLTEKDDKLFIKAMRKIPPTDISIKRSKSTIPKY